jgi:hypothetical protein
MDTDIDEIDLFFQDLGNITDSSVGTHVRLQRPVLFEKAFVNHKNYHSINVQVMFSIQQFNDYISFLNNSYDFYLSRVFVMPITNF